MTVAEYRPKHLEELSSQLASALSRSEAGGLTVTREANSVCLLGEALRKKSGWDMSWQDSVCTLRQRDKEIRLVLDKLDAALEWNPGKFRLCIREKTPGGEASAEEIADLAATAIGARGGMVREVFFRRTLPVLRQLGELSEGALKQAISASSDPEVILAALKNAPAFSPVAEADPLWAAKLRGLAARKRLLESHGGVITAEAAATLLGISRQAVDKRRRNGQLLALETGRRGFLYPVWQFRPGGVLPGLVDVLVSLSDHDPWMQLVFFVSPNEALAGDEPCEALAAGRVEDVVRAADVFGNQGAK